MTVISKNAPEGAFFLCLLFDTFLSSFVLFAFLLFKTIFPKISAYWLTTFTKVALYKCRQKKRVNVQGGYDVTPKIGTI
ncbi:MAG: hypothetical protein DF199_03235 [Lactobacillus delbrueckii subsp. lactis]|nr:MAG: hypothetical protein DF199_03235 [Lactobacillus delbrueckii subsp. lactis]